MNGELKIENCGVYVGEYVSMIFRPRNIIETGV